jgi:uncharacterized membrane protein
MILAARLCSLFFYVILVAYALKLLEKHSVKWIVFTTALLPMSIFQASIINTDATIIAESILIFALYIKLWDTEDSKNKIRLVVVLAVLLILLGLNKPNYVLLSLPFALLPARAFNGLRSYSLAIKGAVILAMLMVLGVWTHLTVEVSKAVPMYRGAEIAAQVKPAEQTMHVITHPFDYGYVFAHSLLIYGKYWFKGVFGLLGWTFVSLSPLIVTGLIVLYVLSILYEGETTRRANKTTTFSFAVVAIIAIISIFFTFYIAYNPVASRDIFGVQGRYFIPLIPFLFYGIKHLINQRYTLMYGWLSWIFPLGSFACLVAAFITYVKAIY